MSYDIAIYVKVEGLDKYAMIAEPECSSPTYNLGEMFRACMDWDFNQSEKDDEGKWHTCYYNCDFVINKVETGIRELRTKRRKYMQYNQPNGWGNIEIATRTLESLRDCIYETSEEKDIPIEHLYMSW